MVLTDVQLEAAQQVGQRMANRIRRLSISVTGNTRVSASCGVAIYHTGDTMESMLERADAAMYREKLATKNVLKSL